MTPKTKTASVFRNAVLELARDHEFARPFVNSGRLSLAVPYENSPLSTPDEDAFGAGPWPGAPLIDAPLGDGGWLLSQFGETFKLLAFDDGAAVDDFGAGIPIVRIPASAALARERYDAAGGEAFLVRPDQHVAARWRRPDISAIKPALERAQGLGGRA